PHQRCNSRPTRYQRTFALAKEASAWNRGDVPSVAPSVTMQRPMLRGRVVFIDLRKRIYGCIPLVPLLILLPRFRQAIFEAHVPTRISWAAEADLIPCPRM